MANGLLMLSDDVYRARLEATTASLRYWVPQIADTARIEETRHPEYWKLRVTPRVAGACPFELLIGSRQKFDLMVGAETYEDQPVVSLDLFLPLVEAIAAGRLVQRHWVSQLTGMTRRVETIITLPGGKSWSGGRTLPGVGAKLAEESCETVDRTFLPYRR